MKRETRRRASAARTISAGAVTLAVVLAPALARAGDPTAHTSAMVTAAWMVSNLPEFAGGVGSPRFAIPTGTLEEVFCPYDYLFMTSFGDGSCAYSDPNGFAINEPDDWSCLDIRQPPAISALNSTVSLSETLLATVLADYKTAMACNWNHFVTNPSLGPGFSAAATAAVTAQWANEIPDSIARGVGPWTCSVPDWLIYYRRVVNGLHYIEDMQTEHHAVGNRSCPQADVVPSSTFDQSFTFAGARSCSDFLADTSQQADDETISCDYAVVLGSRLNPLAFGLSVLCDHGVTLACMGLERLFRHHCNVPDTGVTKSIICSGAPSDHLLSTEAHQYCEGEIYNFGGGQDFVGPAAIASFSALVDAARRWAAVCKDPPGSGIPDPPGNVAASVGDPHLCTFDGVSYELQVYGECTLVKDDHDGMEIQARMHPFGDSRVVAINVGVAASVATDVVGLYLEGRTTLNHVDVTFVEGRNALPHGGAVWRSGQRYTIVWPDNTQVRLALRGGYISPHIYLPDGRRGQVGGLLGNLDRSTAGELVTRQGVALGNGPIAFETFHGAYVESWRVGAGSLFDYPATEGTENFTDRSFPPQPATTAGLADPDRQRATAACQAAQVLPEWVDACVLDVGTTGDRRFAGDLALAPVPRTAIDILPPAGTGGSGGGGAGGAGGQGGGVAVGQPCSTNGDCATGLCSSRTCIDGRSCFAILDAGRSKGDGAYWVDPQSRGAFQVYCDMTTDGGGWTRVAGINAADRDHVTSAAVNPSGMTTATALGKLADAVINGLKSGSEPGFRLTCQNSATPVTGYFSTTCAFSASPTTNATGACTAVAYGYQQPEVYGGQYTQSCVVGVADGDHGAAERLIYGADVNGCSNGTTGCDTQYAHWSGNGSLWVR